MPTRFVSVILIVVHVAALFGLSGVVGQRAIAADNVFGNLINFDNDGYWSWYMDERAIIDPHHGKLLIGSAQLVSGAIPAGRPTGSIDVVTFDLATGNRTRSQLSDIDEDDHNAPGLILDARWPISGHVFKSR